MKDIGEINPAYDENKDDPNSKGNDDLAKSSPDLSPVTPNIIYGPHESRRMLKNIFLISFSFAFLFTAFQSMANLQSSLNQVSNTANVKSNLSTVN